MAKLHFNYGCVGAGKTTYLIQMNEILIHKGSNPLIIKSGIDTRENSNYGVCEISSRLMPEKTIMCYKFKNIREINKLIKDYDYGSILVDEAQFLSKKEVLYLYNLTRKNKIPVFCYGLKTDCNGDLFKGSASLLAFADEVREIKSICNVCYKQYAQMHIRLINNKVDKSNKQTIIETDKIKYLSVCSDCFNNLKER
ncbi:MAG: thymidine kinase [Bacilli bacterium]|nr:thymidine kinase [Bacilli bacterium]